MAERAASLLAGWIAVGALAGAPESNIGRQPSAGELAAARQTVFADGRGLPRGRGSVEAGAVLYRDQCAACHGARGEGVDPYPALVGGIGSLRAPQPTLTVTSYWPSATVLWEYTRRAMPYGAPGSLTVDQVYAVSAYLLSLDGIVPAGTVLDEATLPRVRMPNADGFFVAPSPTLDGGAPRP